MLLQNAIYCTALQPWQTAKSNLDRNAAQSNDHGCQLCTHTYTHMHASMSPQTHLIRNTVVTLGLKTNFWTWQHSRLNAQGILDNVMLIKTG